MCTLMQLGFPEDLYITKISVFDTVCGGLSVTQLSVWNADSQSYVIVYTQARSCPSSYTPGILQVEFEVLCIIKDVHLHIK